jgi:hypothetical protein
MAAKAETKKVKFIRGVSFKGVDFKAGATAEVEPHVADRLIASGDAEEATEKAPKAEKTQKAAEK